MTWSSPKTLYLDPYLVSSSIIQASAPEITELARRLRTKNPDDLSFMRAAFEWVRDHINHSFDVRDPRVTITATEVLAQGVGLCYAKSHLLAALLRSERIPTGLCYQRLATEHGHVIHGLIAVYRQGRWCRLDPRGNNDRVSSAFDLEAESLAYRPNPELGEIDYPQVYSLPASEVITALAPRGNALQIALPSALNP